jgi:hypothetical protein
MGDIKNIDLKWPMFILNTSLSKMIDYLKLAIAPFLNFF